jgi:murein tripeptide amidase MpaA
MTQPALPTPAFDAFLRHGALTTLLQAYAKARPALVELRSMGRSHEGRDIGLVVLSQRDPTNPTQSDRDKPALWVDGNIHAAELLASTACLYFLHNLLTRHDQGDADVVALLATRVVYLCPRVAPDGAELALADRPRHIRSSTRAYPYDEPAIEGLTVEDVDGDGRVLQMRMQDPHGGYKVHPSEPRLMVAREPGEWGGTYYRLMPEGTLAGYDGVNVRVNRDREGLDLNRNFPAFWRQEGEQVGAGPYPTSEPEVRAVVDFVTAHPNIGAAVSFHTHSGVILRPMSTQSDDDMTPEDLWSYKRLSALAEKLTGYPVVSTWHDFKYHPKEVITGTQDWFYEHLGALFWVVELWTPNREAGISGYKWIDWFREHPVDDDLKLIAWSDRACGGQACVPWKPFTHPQLGAVEIGGWDKMNFWRNPPPHLREAEVKRFPAWLLQLGLSLPKLELVRVDVQALAGDRWHVRMVVANAGYLSAAVTKRAVQRKVVRGVVFELTWGQPLSAVTLLVGKPRMEGPHLEGHAPATTQLAFLPSREITADRASAEWVLQAPAGTVLDLTAFADRAGRVRHQLVLAA